MTKRPLNGRCVKSEIRGRDLGFGKNEDNPPSGIETTFTRRTQAKIKSSIWFRLNFARQNRTGFRTGGGALPSRTQTRSRVNIVLKTWPSWSGLCGSAEGVAPTSGGGGVLTRSQLYPPPLNIFLKA